MDRREFLKATVKAAVVAAIAPVVLEKKQENSKSFDVADTHITLEQLMAAKRAEYYQMIERAALFGVYTKEYRTTAGILTIIERPLFGNF